MFLDLKIFLYCSAFLLILGKILMCCVFRIDSRYICIGDIVLMTLIRFKIYDIMFSGLIIILLIIVQYYNIFRSNSRVLCNIIPLTATIPYTYKLYNILIPLNKSLDNRCSINNKQNQFPKL